MITRFQSGARRSMKNLCFALLALDGATGLAIGGFKFGGNGATATAAKKSLVSDFSAHPSLMPIARPPLTALPPSQ